MNNRYLYRAKRTDNGEWVEGYLLNIAKINAFICTGKIKLDGTLKGIVAPEMYAVDPYTICQCTGLMDKSGKMIFEHEIVRECHSEYIGEVKFGEHGKGYGWYIEWISEKSHYYRVDFLYWQREVSLEVIGSIFDTPELLQNDEQEERDE